MTTTLFVNPSAGRGRCRKIYPMVLEKLGDAGVKCDVVVSQYPGHITRVSSDLAARGQDTVIACGGDGTVNEVLNGVGGTKTALGVVPVGTTNFFAANVGIGKDIDAACKSIKERQTEEIDLVRINDDKLFAGIGCLGFDSEVAAFVGRRRKEKSHLFFSRLRGNLLKFLSYRPKTVELRFSGDRYFGKVLLAAFCDGRSYAQKIMTPPEHVLDDPFLYVSVVRPMAKWRLLSRFPSVSKKANPKNKEVSVHRTDSVHVQSLGPMEFYVDGDFMTTTPFRLEVMPKHLNVIVGSQAS